MRVTLEVLAALVSIEGNAFQQIAQEVLPYLQALMAAEPHNVVVCLHKLIVSIFGIQPASSRAQTHTASPLDLLEIGDDMDALHVSRGHEEQTQGWRYSPLLAW